MRDMKEIIAEAAENLLFKKKVRRLTVKEIVEECGITRQAFYYHFADIPELMRWVLEKDSHKLLKECLMEEDTESRLYHLFSFAVSMQPYVNAGSQSNYGDEIERLLDEFIYDFFEPAARHMGMYEKYGAEERRFLIKYHCIAIRGLLSRWTARDTENMRFVVHQVNLLLRGEISPF